MFMHVIDIYEVNFHEIRILYVRVRITGINSGTDTDPK